MAIPKPKAMTKPVISEVPEAGKKRFRLKKIFAVYDIVMPVYPDDTPEAQLLRAAQLVENNRILAMRPEVDLELEERN